MEMGQGQIWGRGKFLESYPPPQENYPRSSSQNNPNPTTYGPKNFLKMKCYWESQIVKNFLKSPLTQLMTPNNFNLGLPINTARIEPD